MTKRWWRRADSPTDESDESGPDASSSWDSSRCPTCGRAHPLQTDATFEWFSDDELDQISLERSGPGAASDERSDAIVSDATVDLNPAPRWLPAALVLAAVGGLAALMIFGGGGADTTEQAVETPDEIAAEPTVAEPTAIPTVDPEVEAAAAAETQRQRHEVASIWARTLVPAAAEARVVYRTENSVALVDLAAGEQRELRLDVPVDLSTEGFAYLGSGRGTWVINPSSLDAALRLAPQAEIGPLADATSSIVVPEPGARFIMLSQHDGRVVRPIVEVPPTSDVLVVGGRGAIVTPPSGGSTLVNSLGAQPLTDGRVLTANADYLIELRCEPLRCAASVRAWPPISDEGVTLDNELSYADDQEVDESSHDDTADDDTADYESADAAPGAPAAVGAVELPGDIWTSTTLALAPSGEWLIVANDQSEAWQLYDLRSGVAEIAGSGTDPAPLPATAVVWAPDSSYFVFIDDDGVVVGSPDMPTALAKVPLQFAPLGELQGSELMVLSG